MLGANQRATLVQNYGCSVACVREVHSYGDVIGRLALGERQSLHGANGDGIAVSRHGADSEGIRGATATAFATALLTALSSLTATFTCIVQILVLACVNLVLCAAANHVEALLHAVSTTCLTWVRHVGR